MIISFSSTARIPLELPHAKPLFTLSMLRRQRDAEMRHCTTRYCWKLPTSFNLQLFCINKGDRATFVGKEVRTEKGDLNEICASVINNGLMVYPPTRIIFIIIAGWETNTHRIGA